MGESSSPSLLRVRPPRRGRVRAGGWRRTVSSPIRSDPEGSSRNEIVSGRLTNLPPVVFHRSCRRF